MVSPFILLLGSALLLLTGLYIPFRLWQRRLNLGVPWKFHKIPELTSQTLFSRRLFRMQGMTVGPVPLKAPLSGKDCYFFEVIHFPHGGKKSAGTVILNDGKEFEFFGPKGTVRVNPRSVSRDCMESKVISQWSRAPLPLELRQKLLKMNAEEGSVVERIVPAFRETYLIGRAGKFGPNTWRLEKGPGIFPLISSEAIHAVEAQGMSLSRTQILKATLLLGLSFSGFYLVWQILTFKP